MYVEGGGAATDVIPKGKLVHSSLLDFKGNRTKMRIILIFPLYVALSK